MYVTGYCKKCKGKVAFDVADLNQEQVERFLEERDFGHCATGFHVEVGKMANYYILNWKRIFKTEQEAINFNKMQIQS